MPISNVIVSWWHHDPLCCLCHSAVASKKVNKGIDYDDTQVLSVTFQYLRSQQSRGEAVLQKVGVHCWWFGSDEERIQ